jgi:hypothetical protein
VNEKPNASSWSGEEELDDEEEEEEVVSDEADGDLDRIAAGRKSPSGSRTLEM